MNEKIIIGVSGKLSVGKDTFTQNLISEIKDINNKDIKCKVTEFVTFGKYIDTSNQILYYKLAFADPIKHMAKLAFPILTNDDLWGPSKNRMKVLPDYINPKTKEMLSVRDILQYIGQWGRETNPNCWVNATFGLIDHYYEAAINKKPYKKICFILSDVRFKNEKAAIENVNGRVVRIINDQIKHTSTDISEIDLDDVELYKYAAVVKNNKDLNHLQCEAKRVLRKFLY